MWTPNAEWQWKKLGLSCRMPTVVATVPPGKGSRGSFARILRAEGSFELLMCSPREAERHWVSLLAGSPTAQAVLKFDVGLLGPLSHCEYRARIAGPLFAVGLRIQVVPSNEEKPGCWWSTSPPRTSSGCWGRFGSSRPIVA